jgi:opacity protein-like surface antigen
MRLINYTAGIAALAFSAAAFSSNLEISAAMGPSWIHANSTQLIVSPYETDSLKTKNISSSAQWKIGLGYHLFAEQLAQRKFFNDLLLELNLYRNSGTLKGNVWQFELPEFNNYTFSAPITSTRLMLDVKPSLFTFHAISFYPILGMGISWNKISYQETAIDSETSDSSQSLSQHTNTNFTYDAGLGARFDISEHLNASVEYLYTHLGTVSPSAISLTNTALLSPPKFKLSNQSVLFGLGWKF